MPLKVLMFGWELPPYNSGGLGVACDGLTKALAGQDVDITFVLPHTFDIKVQHMRLVFADKSASSLANFDPYRTQAGFSGGLDPDLAAAVSRYASRAAEIASHYPHDLIHAHDWLCFPAGAIASKTSHRPLVTHVHATEYDRSGGLSVNPHVYSLEKFGLDSSAEVIAVSQFTKNLLTRYYLTSPDKVNVVHNGINPSEYPDTLVYDDPLQALKKNGFKIVLYVGRITLQKGLDYLLKSAQQVLSYHPKTVFLIAGSGDMQQQIIEMTVQLGISDNVLFAGFLRGQLLQNVFRSADLFVMPSVSEPFGITALESVASGTPAIVSRQSGVSEALSHVLKVDFWDVDEITNKVLSVLYYPSLHKTLQDNGRQESKNLSWQNAAQKTISVYHKALKNN